MVIRQYKAKGPVSEMLLPVVAMDDAAGLIAFAVSINIAQSLASGATMTAVNMLLMPLVEIIGSLALGVALGFVLSFCVRFFASRGNKLALTICFVLLALALCDTRLLEELVACAKASKHLRTVIGFDGTANHDAELDRVALSKSVKFEPVKTGRDVKTALGRVTLTPGRFDIRVKAVKIEGEELLRLRSVILTPVRATP